MILKPQMNADISSATQLWRQLKTFVRRANGQTLTSGFHLRLSAPICGSTGIF